MYDLERILRRIQQEYNKNANFILWGRSMGAVTIMRYLMERNHQNVLVSVLDSPFLDVEEVICQMANQKLGFPKILINMFLKYLDPIIS